MYSFGTFRNKDQFGTLKTLTRNLNRTAEETFSISASSRKKQQSTPNESKVWVKCKNVVEAYPWIKFLLDLLKQCSHP